MHTAAPTADPTRSPAVTGASSPNARAVSTPTASPTPAANTVSDGAGEGGGGSADLLVIAIAAVALLLIVTAVLVVGFRRRRKRQQLGNGVDQSHTSGQAMTVNPTFVGLGPALVSSNRATTGATNPSVPAFQQHKHLVAPEYSVPAASGLTGHDYAETATASKYSSLAPTYGHEPTQPDPSSQYNRLQRGGNPNTSSGQDYRVAKVDGADAPSNGHDYRRSGGEGLAVGGYEVPADADGESSLVVVQHTYATPAPTTGLYPSTAGHTAQRPTPATSIDGYLIPTGASKVAEYEVPADSEGESHLVIVKQPTAQDTLYAVPFEDGSAYAAVRPVARESTSSV